LFDITIIIPTYNRSTLVGQAIKSVLSQSYDAFQLLVLDDYSSDDTCEVVSSLKDSRIQYIRHKCHIGFTANWTYGVKLAAGKYLCILGDDDYYDQNYLINRLELFHKYPAAVAVTGAFRCIDKENRFIRNSKVPCNSVQTFTGQKLIKLLLGYTGEWFNGATLYKRELIDLCWDSAIRAGTALDLAVHIQLSLIDESLVVFRPEPEMNLRVHPEQESVSNGLYLAECAAILALYLWNFEPRIRKTEYINLFRNCFTKDINHFGRMLWYQGRRREAQAAFLTELRIDPFRFKTWLRYIRCLLLSS